MCCLWLPLVMILMGSWWSGKLLWTHIFLKLNFGRFQDFFFLNLDDKNSRTSNMKIKGVMFVCFCNHGLGQIVRGMDKSYVIRQSRVVDLSLAKIWI